MPATGCYQHTSLRILIIFIYLLAFPFNSYSQEFFSRHLEVKYSPVLISNIGVLEDPVMLPVMGKIARASVRENPSSSKAWLIENSQLSTSHNTGTLASHSEPGEASIVFPHGTDNRVSTDFISDSNSVPIKSWGGGAMAGGAMAGASKGAPGADLAGQHLQEASGTKDEDQRKKSKCVSHEDPFLDIECELETQLPTAQRAYELNIIFKSLPIGTTAAEKRSRMKVNGILKGLVYGPGNLSNSKQLLDYIEYLEGKKQIQNASDTLHRHLWKWQKNVISGALKPMDSDTLFWATNVCLRLMLQLPDGEYYLDSDLEELQLHIPKKTELDKLTSELESTYPDFDSKLYLKALILYGTRNISNSRLVDDYLKKLDLQVNILWLGVRGLRTEDLYTYLKFKISELSSSSTFEQKQEVEALLVLGREITDSGTSAMNMLFKFECLYYNALGYTDEESPLSQEIDYFDQCFLSGHYQQTLDAIETFLQKRQRKVTLKLGLKIDSFHLKTYAALYAKTKEKQYREKARKLIESQGYVDDGGVPMMVNVLRDLDDFDSAIQYALRLIELGQSGQVDIRTIHKALEVLAECTMVRDKHTSLFYYRMLQGTLKFPPKLNLLARCELNHQCQMVQRQMQSMAGWSSELGFQLQQATSAADMVHMYKNLRRYAHYQEALTVGSFILAPFYKNFLLHSGFFNLEGSGSKFFDSVTVQMVTMSYVVDDFKQCQYHLDNFKKTRGNDQVFAVIADLCVDDASTEGATIRLMKKYTHERLTYCLLSVQYDKLIFLLRQYQISGLDNVEIGFLFWDLWEAVLVILKGSPEYRNSQILADHLSLIYKKYNDLLLPTIDANNIESLKTLVQSTSEHYSKLSGTQCPSHMNPTSDFFILESLVLQEEPSIDGIPD